jgi:hypothetical protein
MNFDLTKARVRRQVAQSWAGQPLSRLIAVVREQADADAIGGAARADIMRLNNNPLYAESRLLIGKIGIFLGLVVLALTALGKWWLDNKMGAGSYPAYAGLAVVATVAVLLLGSGWRMLTAHYLPLYVDSGTVARARQLLDDLGETNAPRRITWWNMVRFLGHSLEICFILLVALFVLGSVLPGWAIYWAAMGITLVVSLVWGQLERGVVRRLQNIRLRRTYRRLVDTGNTYDLGRAERLRRLFSIRLEANFSEPTWRDYVLIAVLVVGFVAVVAAVCVVRVLTAEDQSVSTIVSTVLLGTTAVVIFGGSLWVEIDLTSLAGEDGEEAARILRYWPTEEGLARYYDDLARANLAMMQRALLAGQHLYNQRRDANDPTKRGPILAFRLTPLNAWNEPADTGATAVDHDAKTPLPAPDAVAGANVTSLGVGAGRTAHV